MPSSLKAVITISAWVLFIKGWLSILAGTWTVSTVSMAGKPPPLSGIAECAVGSAALILACVAAWLRQKVE